MKNPFGTYTLLVEGNVMYLTCKGMFNARSTRLYVKEARALVSQFEGREFFIVLDFLEMEGATPEAYKITETFNQWVNTQNMVAKAIVANNTMIGKIATSRMPSTNVQNIQYFYKIEDALNWFETQKTQ